MNIINNFSSPNYSPRKSKVKYIILHYTDMHFTEALEKLISPKSTVSCHYLIKDDGNIFQLVEEENIAWHVGESSWKDDSQLNQNSIGIEMDNLGTGEFSQAQIRSCINLCHHLTKKYELGKFDVLGHSDVAPDRKIDPGIFFNWQVLAANGIGLWHDIKYSQDLASEIIYEFGDNSSKVQQLQKDFCKIGYKADVSGRIDTQTNFVIRAFQARFCPEVIRNKGGINYYRNLESVYDWDAFSDKVLQELLKRI